MHSLESRSTIPGFIAKLWSIVDDPASNELISWSSSGSSFIIHNQVRFSLDLLPKYFKHSNMASFIRQLNMYGFRKVVNVDLKVKSDAEVLEFYHPFFVMGEETLLELIKRKPTVTRNSGALDLECQQTVREMLEDMQVLHGKQENVSAQLMEMKKENEALWKEVSMLRHKHEQQQKMVNQLIQFFFGFLRKTIKPVQIKRKLPSLMDGKVANKSLKLDIPGLPINGKNMKNPMDGPSIKEITEFTSTNEDQMMVPEPAAQVILESPINSPANETLPTLEPNSPSLEITALSPNSPDIRMTKTPGSSLNTPIWSPASPFDNHLSPEDSSSLKLDMDNFESHIEGTAEELNWLHEQLPDQGLQADLDELFKLEDQIDKKKLTDLAAIQAFFKHIFNYQNNENTSTVNNDIPDPQNKKEDQNSIQTSLATSSISSKDVNNILSLPTKVSSTSDVIVEAPTPDIIFSPPDAIISPSPEVTMPSSPDVIVAPPSDPIVQGPVKDGNFIVGHNKEVRLQNGSKKSQRLQLSRNELTQYIHLDPPPPAVELEVPVTPLDFDTLLGLENNDNLDI